MPRILNWELLKHPMNWLTIILMVLIGGIALHFILTYQTAPTSAPAPNK